MLPLFIGLNLTAQTTKTDSARISKLEIETEEVHSPKKATLYSAIVPGLGQAYNKKYWKIPLVYIGFGTIGYFIHWNNDNYKTMKLAYFDLTDGSREGPFGADDPTNSYADLPAYGLYDLNNSADYNNFKTGLAKQQDYYRRNRDLLMIGILGFYGLQIIDASVDAHLFDFDMGEDLTLNWQPCMQPFKNQLVYGINCSFTF